MMRSRAGLLAAVVFAGAFVSPAQRDDRGRPVILMVHGRGMAGRDTAALRELWRDGLAAGAKSLSKQPVLADRDVRLVWYADVLEPSSLDRCSYASSDPRARRDATGDPDLKTFVSMVGNVLGMLTTLVADNESASELRSLSGDASFLGDSHKRCAAEQRLADAIDRAVREGRPVIIVAHSLGSLVAYDYLSARRDSGLVQRVVSIGSPLGSSALRHLLLGGDSTESFDLPPSVKSWINVRSAADPFAVPLSIARDVVTSTAADEPDTHEMTGYLRNPATASAIIGGWCAAFVGQAPSGCTNYGLKN
jgi:pimeloyl-ACP methyl ester carboxylesterase